MFSFFDFNGVSDPLGMLAVTGIFTVGALFFFPRPLMCIAAGVVLGNAAIPIALFGSTLGAAIGFLIARYCFREAVVRWVSKRPLWKAVLRALDEEGWRIIFLLRFASPIPGSLTNYVFGISGVHVLPYCAATLLGLAPQVVLFVEIGALGQQAVWSSHQGAKWLLTSAGVAVTGWVIFLLTKRAKRLLEQKSIVADAMAD